MQVWSVVRVVGAAAGVALLLAVGCAAPGAPQTNTPLRGVVPSEAADSARRRVIAWVRGILVQSGVDASGVPSHLATTRPTAELPDEVLAGCVQAGRILVPDLIGYSAVSDDTCCAMWLPPNGGANRVRYTVQQLACHLIEVALRGDAEVVFTPMGASHERDRTDALGDAYEEWYERCYDNEAAAWISGPDELPKAPGVWTRRPSQ